LFPKLTCSVKGGGSKTGWRTGCGCGSEGKRQTAFTWWRRTGLTTWQWMQHNASHTAS